MDLIARPVAQVCWPTSGHVQFLKPTQTLQRLVGLTTSHSKILAGNVGKILNVLLPTS